jgi:hypothetical protein
LIRSEAGVCVECVEVCEEIFAEQAGDRKESRAAEQVNAADEVRDG